MSLRYRPAGVCLTCPYPLSRVTGIGTFVRSLARNLREGGVATLVIHPSIPGPFSAGELCIPLRWRVLSSIELAIKTAIRLIAERSRYEIVHMQQAHLQSLAATIVTRALGKPSVITLHVRPPAASEWLRKIGHTLIERLCLTLVDLPVAVSPFVAESFRDDGIRVIENGVDTDAFHPSGEIRAAFRRALGVEGDLVFLFVGRWARSKGLPILFNAVVSSALENKRFRVLVVGEPVPDEPELAETLFARIRNGDRVQVMGPASDNLTRYLNAADVLVSPSQYEGMPLGVLEAMASGLPVLLSDIPVHRFLVERAGCGWTFLRGDSTDLARVMSSIVESGIPEGWQDRSREAVLRYNSLETMTAAYREVYVEVMGLIPAIRR